MRILVLWADDQSPNLGVRVLGAGTEALARSVWPEAEFVFHNYGAKAAPVRIGSVGAIAKEAVSRRAGLIEWFRTFDLVLDTRAGDSFADIYGLSRLGAMSASAEVAHRSGTPVVLTPQTIGPFESRASRAIARRTLKTAAVVMSRDGISAETSAALGRPVDVETTDVVFALPVPPRTGERDVVLNVSGLLWRPGPHVDYQHYRSFLTDLYKRLVGDGRTVSLLAHVLPSDNPDDDVPSVEEFRELIAHEAEILIPSSLGDVREMVAGASLVIGSRMHACLNALSVGTPSIALAYSRKFAPLMSELGWRHVFDLRDSSAGMIDSLMAASRQPELEAEAAGLRSRAEASLDRAREYLARAV